MADETKHNRGGFLMSPRVRYWMMHGLDVLTWPASLIFKAVRGAIRVARRQINQRA